MEIKDKNRQKIDKRRMAAVYAGLFVFGIAYDRLIEWLEERGYDDGYTSDLVVLGTAVTLAGTLPLVGLRSAAVTLGAFVASGLPVSLSSKLRYKRWREREGRSQGMARNGRFSSSQGNDQWAQHRPTFESAAVGQRASATAGRGRRSVGSGDSCAQRNGRVAGNASTSADDGRWGA